MARKVSPVPKGYRTVTPYLTVRGVEAAIDFYQRAFGAEELSRVYGADGSSIVHAELKIGNSVILLGEEMPAFGIFAPSSLQGSPVAVHLYLPNASEIWASAMEAGGAVIVPLAEVYWGELFGKLRDPFGHIWSLSKRVEILTPAEIALRAAGGFAAVAVDPAEDFAARDDDVRTAVA
jgi:PhnB protein